MTTRTSPFGDRPFAVSAGAARGLGRGAMAGTRFIRPFHGVRVWRESAVSLADPRSELTRMCEQFAVRMPSSQFFSHETALVLAGTPTPIGWVPTIHVSTYRPASGPRSRGVTGHRLQNRERSPWRIGDLAVEDPVRAWVQTSRTWLPDDLIAAGDFLVGPGRLATADELRAEALLLRGHALDDVLGQIRVGAESARETRLRLELIRAGLPEPALNLTLRHPDGRHIARLDLAYPDYRVGVEYDGRQHAFSAEQFARDADRWDDIRAAGWTHVRILHHHMVNGSAVTKVRTALERSGWPQSR